MDNLHKASTLILVLLGVWVAANWKTITTAWRYRKEIEQAAALAEPLQQLGVIK